MNGVGQYVTDAGVAVTNINVDWGYTVQVSAAISNPLNYGSQSNPVSGMNRCMVVAWLLHGFCMVFAWLLHGCCMVVAWLLHGCWLLHVVNSNSLVL
jgi:hypothetical protein